MAVLPVQRDLPVQRVDHTGLVVQWHACDTDGDQFLNNGDTIILVDNSGGVTRTVTVDSRKDCEQGTDHNYAMDVANDETRMLGPFHRRRVNDDSGYCHVSYSSASGLMIAVIRVDRTVASVAEWPPPAPDQDPEETGWTDRQALIDAANAVYYVDASRPDDTGDGLSPATAKKTLAAGYALLTNLQNDALLLKRGEKWTASFTTYPTPWAKGGPSAASPMMVGAYGTETDAMPIISATDTEGLYYAQAGGGNVHFYDIDFYCTERDPDHPDYDAGALNKRGVWVYTASSDIRFEGCAFRWYGLSNIVVQYNDGVPGAPTRVTFFRCVSHNSWRTGDTAQGIYSDRAVDLTLEECILDNNGWDSDDDSTRNAGSHNMYHSGSTGLTVTKCLSTSASSMGVKLRSEYIEPDWPIGTTITNNYIWDCPIGVSFGGQPVISSPRWKTSTTTGNVVDNGGCTNPPHFQNLRSGVDLVAMDDATISQNLFIHSTQPSTDQDSAINVYNNPHAGTVLISQNIEHEWDSQNTVWKDQSTAPYDQYISWVNNTEKQTAETWADPTRRLETYATSIGEASADSFITRCLQQRKGNWDSRYTAEALCTWVKAGYS